jgi:hypothetical protein
VNTFINLIAVVVLLIAVVACVFNKKQPVRSGDSHITYDDYLELMDKLEQIHEELEVR